MYKNPKHSHFKGLKLSHSEMYVNISKRYDTFFKLYLTFPDSCLNWRSKEQGQQDFNDILSSGFLCFSGDKKIFHNEEVPCYIGSYLSLNIETIFAMTMDFTFLFHFHSDESGCNSLYKRGSSRLHSLCFQLQDRHHGPW